VCRICGKRIDEPVEQAKMPGLEITRVAEDGGDVAAGTMPGLEQTTYDPTAPVEVEPIPGLEATHVESLEVAVEPMPGLITNEEVLGDTRIPDEPVDTSRCPRCKVDLGEARFCPRCGYAVVAKKGVDVESGPMVTCTECGVPNPQGRKRCMACGNRI
jgi:hypothetical protein